ncbi:MAG TPA: NfeD family protein [Acidimicrobiia bacterium]|nr:NfeD family protein [Acidimicrobiia bacterium]
MLIKSVSLRFSHLRSFRRLALLLCISGIVLCTLLPNAFAATPDTGSTLNVSNVHIGGFMDPHNEALISQTLKSANENNVSLYVIQLDSNGVAGADINRIARKLSQADFVVAIWVGPTSAVYSDVLSPLLEAADFVGAADKSLANKSDATIIAPSLREFLAQLDNKKVSRLDYVLDMGCSKKEVTAEDAKSELCKDVKFAKNENFQLNIAPRFEKLSPIANLGHSLIKPGFAMGLLVMGLCLLAFEFFAASVGVAAIAGTIASLCGVYGLGYLPTQWWAVALCVLGVGALVIDVQAGGVGLYTAVGSVSIFAGTFFATDRSGPYGVTIVGAIIITIMALLFAVGAIPSLIRTRFGTPTIGREDFIGDEGIADGDIDPEGSVKLRGGSWKARTNHATPIKDGEKCRIIKIEGIILEVEPLVGAAIDHREKRRS